MITAFVKSNSCGLISQSAFFVRGGGIVFGSKWLPVFPYRAKKKLYEKDHTIYLQQQQPSFLFLSKLG
jgi:hypothetical protein